MKTNKKFSGDVVPLSDLKVNPDRVISQFDKTHRPMLLTSRGRGVAAFQSVKDNEADAEGRAFIKAVAQCSLTWSRDGPFKPVVTKTNFRVENSVESA